MSFKKVHIVSMTLVLLSVLLVSIGFAYPVIALSIDTTPPKIDSFMMAAKGSFVEVSKDTSNPTMMTKGYIYYFFGYAKENGNVSSGLIIDIFDSTGKNVFVAGLPETKRVAFFDTYLHQFYSDTVTWAPQLEGLYTIKLSVTDEAGNTGRDVRYVEAKTEIQEVSGYFAINGIKIEPPGDINITLVTRDLVFEFVCATGADNVYETGNYRPMVTGFPDTIVYLNRQSGTDTWKGSYTVPKDGVYNIHGVVTTKQGQIKGFMSILVTVGEPKPSLLSIRQIGFIVAGLGLIAFGTFAGTKRRFNIKW